MLYLYYRFKSIEFFLNTGHKTLLSFAWAVVRGREENRLAKPNGVYGRAIMGNTAELETKGQF